MPFDPKLIPEDNAGFEGDLKLPDDLAVMAEQLGEDAARLAATYPPRRRTELCSVQPVPSRRSSTWLARSLAGTALAAGLVTISLVAMNSYQPDEQPAAVRSSGDENGNTQAQPHRPAHAGRSPAEREIPVTPASWLGDTSGPELEALMDLWEQDQPKVRSLSF